MSLVRERLTGIYHFSVTYITQQSTSSHDNFSFIVMSPMSHNNIFFLHMEVSLRVCMLCLLWKGAHNDDT